MLDERYAEIICLRAEPGYGNALRI